MRLHPPAASPAHTRSFARPFSIQSVTPPAGSLIGSFVPRRDRTGEATAAGGITPSHDAAEPCARCVDAIEKLKQIAETKTDSRRIPWLGSVL